MAVFSVLVDSVGAQRGKGGKSKGISVDWNKKEIVIKQQNNTLQGEVIK
jgi:hypothetical protein